MRIVEADLTNAEHGAAIVQMISAHAASAFGRCEVMTDQERARLIPALAGFPAKHVFLASDGSAFCGVAICFLQLATFSGRQMLKIHDLFVREEHRGRGYGRALVQAAIDYARKLDCAFVNVEVAIDNPGATALYRKLGFGDWLTPTQFLELRL